MSIGSRIYEARLEANLSQRELAGEQITRNMLSLMEHGKTQPSLETLTYLAQRLAVYHLYTSGHCECNRNDAGSGSGICLSDDRFKSLCGYLYG